MPPGDAPRRRRPPRVFLGPVEIAGYYRGLKTGFDELGIPCRFVNLTGHVFRYGGDQAGPLVRLIQWLSTKRGRKARFLETGARTVLLLTVIFRYDVFIFGFGQSLLSRNRDVTLLKRLGKKLIFQFHGSDSRPPFLDGAFMHVTGDRAITECIQTAREKKAALKKIDSVADVVIDLPTQGHFHERPFVLWLRVGLPTRPLRYPAVPPLAYRGSERPLRILHSPSDPIAKGSALIRETVAQLNASGLKLELVEVVGKPNAVVLEELERCDFVIDQLYADYGMPGFATEAAWFGKPVLIAGYARELWESLLPKELIPPTHYVHPDDLRNAIETLARDADYREDLAKRARAFVENVWSPKAVAERYLRLINEPAPPEWMIDPKTIRYWHGVCHPESRARSLLKEFVAAGGREALQLADKPELEQLLLSKAS